MSAILNVIKSQWRTFSNAHPLVKGIISYTVIWPTANVIQQTSEGKNLKTYDWVRVIRFTAYGSLVAATTSYYWLRFSALMWSSMSLRTGLVKAAVDHISFTPFAYATFYYVLSLLELKTPKEAAQEVKEKFWSTYKTGLYIWPLSQTINYAIIPERNRLVFLSFCSLIWAIFLSYMKSKDMTIQNPETLPKIES